MDFGAVTKTALNLMMEHKLIEQGWWFDFNTMKQCLGYCWGPPKKRIEISIYYARGVEDEAALRRLVLHEIAHALVGVNHGHDSVWREMSLRIGGDGLRCTANPVPAPGKVEVTCSGCRQVHRWYRKPRYRNYRCKCGGGIVIP